MAQKPKQQKQQDRRINDDTPGDWRLFAVFPEAKRGRFRVQTAVCGSTPGALTMAAARLPAETNSRNLTKPEALTLWAQLEKMAHA